MDYSFARIGAAIGMRVENVFTQNRRLWVRLHEKGSKQHAMPCHHNLESYLHAYIGGAGLASDPKTLLFQTYSRATGQLTGNPLPHALLLICGVTDSDEGWRSSREVIGRALAQRAALAVQKIKQTVRKLGGASSAAPFSRPTTKQSRENRENPPSARLYGAF